MSDAWSLVIRGSFIYFAMVIQWCYLTPNESPGVKIPYFYRISTFYSPWVLSVAAGVEQTTLIGPPSPRFLLVLSPSHPFRQLVRTKTHILEPPWDGPPPSPTRGSWSLGGEWTSLLSHVDVILVFEALSLISRPIGRPVLQKSGESQAL